MEKNKKLQMVKNKKLQMVKNKNSQTTRDENFQLAAIRHLNKDADDNIVCITSGCSGVYHSEGYQRHVTENVLEILHDLQGPGCYKFPYPNVSIVENLEYGQFQIHTILNVKDRNMASLKDSFCKAHNTLNNESLRDHSKFDVYVNADLGKPYNKYHVERIHDVLAESKKILSKCDGTNISTYKGTTQYPHLIKSAGMVTETI